MNSRLDELQSSFLRIKLKNLDKCNEARKRCARLYLKKITNPNVELPTVKNGDHVWHIFSIHCEQRDNLRDVLKEKEIETNIHYPIPIHLQKSFTSYGYTENSFPTTEKLARTELSLPMYYGLTDDEVGYISDVINDYLKD